MAPRDAQPGSAPRGSGQEHPLRVMRDRARSLVGGTAGKARAGADEARLHRQVAAIREKLQSGSPASVARAAADARSLARAHPDSAIVLRVAVDAERAAGDPLAALRLVRALRTLRDARPLADLERQIAGDLLVAGPGWVPVLPMAREVAQAEPDAAGATPFVVLPPAGVSPGTSSWVGKVLAAIAAAGPCLVIAPFAVGATTTAGATVAGPAAANPRIRWLMPDGGAQYPAQAPADSRLTDDAWLALAALQGSGASMLVSLVEDDDARGLVVGQALHVAAGLPLAVVAHPQLSEGLRARLRTVEPSMTLTWRDDPESMRAAFAAAVDGAPETERRP